MGTTIFPEHAQFELPLFPLKGALLLPEGNLPLNIFEPRYLAMVQMALAGDRLIGMIQPCPCVDKMPEASRPYYQIGCIGRITAFEETPDGRMLITLRGLMRFSLVTHKLHEDGYCVAQIDCRPYLQDLQETAPLPPELSRACMLKKLEPYLEKEGLHIDWTVADSIPDCRLYTLLAMVCPFQPAEKQALLEATSFAERYNLLKSLFAMACAEESYPKTEGSC